MRRDLIRAVTLIVLAILILPAIGLGSLLLAQSKGMFSDTTTFKLQSGGLYTVSLIGVKTVDAIGYCRSTGNTTVTLTINSDNASGTVIITGETGIVFTGNFHSGKLQDLGEYELIEANMDMIGAGKYAGFESLDAPFTILLKPYVTEDTSSVVGGVAQIDMNIELTTK